LSLFFVTSFSKALFQPYDVSYAGHLRVYVCQFGLRWIDISRKCAGATFSFNTF